MVTEPRSPPHVAGDKGRVRFCREKNNKKLLNMKLCVLVVVVFKRLCRKYSSVLGTIVVENRL